jgi:hypothetical protein
MSGTPCLFQADHLTSFVAVQFSERSQNMTAHVLMTDDPAASAVRMCQRPSVDEWILQKLCDEGAQTMDQLGQALPAVNWAQFFLAIDRLSRSHQIILWPPKDGEYLISLASTSSPSASTTATR